MKYKKDILNHELDTSTKKKYISPSLRLCEALSLKCVLNEGPASAGGYGGNLKPPSKDEMEEGFAKQRFSSKFYNGFDE